MAKSNDEQKLMLGKPRFTSGEPRPVSEFIYYTVVMFLGVSGSLMCFFTAFNLLPSLLPMLGLGFLFSVICSCQFLFGRWRMPVALGILLVWVILVIFLRERLTYGATYVFNVMMRTYSRKLTFNLPTIRLLAVTKTQLQGRLTTFAVFVEFPLTWLLSFVYIRQKSALGAFSLTGIPVLLPMAFSILPVQWALALIMTFWAFLLVSASSTRYEEYTEKSRGRFFASGRVFTQPGALLILPVICLFLALTLAIFPKDAYVRPQVFENIKTGVVQSMELPAIFREGNGGSGGDTVNLADLGKRVITGETAMRAKYEIVGDNARRSFPVEKEYVKSFAGGVYTGSAWERLSSDDMYDLDEVLGEQPAQTLPADIASTAYGIESDVYRLILRKKSPSRLIYVPYGMSSNSELPKNASYADDGYVRSASFFSYVTDYNVCTGFINEAFISAVFPEADDGTAAELNEVQKVERAYSEFVKEKYTLLPEKTESAAMAFLAKYDIPLFEGGDIYDIYEYAEMIQAALTVHCKYSLAPPTMSEGKEFLSFFLNESKKGYCVHFATAEALLLRASGIPTRYADGFVIPECEGSQWVDVPDNNSHAWVEVYIDGLGWLPIEATPPVVDAPAACANGRHPTPAEIEAMATPEPTPTPVPVEKEDEEEEEEYFHEIPQVTPPPTPAFTLPEKDKHAGLKAFLSFLLIVLAVVSPLIILAVARVIRIRIRRKQFNDKDTSKAGLKIYAHLTKLYRENLILPYNGMEPPAEAEEIALKARFSTHQLTREELDELIEMADAMEKRLSSKLKRSSYLRCKYLLALF